MATTKKKADLPGFDSRALARASVTKASAIDFCARFWIRMTPDQRKPFLYRPGFAEVAAFAKAHPPEVIERDPRCSGYDWAEAWADFRTLVGWRGVKKDAWVKLARSLRAADQGARRREEAGRVAGVMARFEERAELRRAEEAALTADERKLDQDEHTPRVAVVKALADRLRISPTLALKTLDRLSPVTPTTSEKN